MHCGQEIVDVYLYKLAPKPMELQVKLKGKIVSEFGQTNLDELESKDADYNAKEDEPEVDPNSPSSAGFIDRVHFSNLESGMYAMPPERKLSTKARTYTIGSILIVVVLAIATVAIVQLLPEDIKKDELNTATGEGKRLEKYPNGTPKAKWTVKKLADGSLVIDGRWQEFHQNGKPKTDGDYVEGQKQGLWVTYFDNGTVESQLTYKDDQLIGEFERWHSNGQKAEAGKWENGEKIGSWMSWHPNGNLAQNIEYKDGQLNGASFTYYNNDTAKERGQYVEGLKHGLWVLMYSDKTVEEKVRWEHGKRHGKAFGNHTNGLLAYEGEWDTGKRIGEWVRMTASGAFIEEGEYVDGLRHGEFKLYHDNGIIKETGRFENDKRVGDWIETDESGEVIAHHAYADGELTSTVAYFQGEEVDVKNASGDDGSASERWTERKSDGRKHGHYKRFYATGELLESGVWLDGKKHGKWCTFDKEGNVISEVKFNNGVEVVDE
ncbi:toxin-antitoxin system YwqK family antitoxin [Planctomycetota bacterium]|nr:toxin-antitoxin system YwqK family antitoxin [Planctomycetota bacterium]